MFIQSSTSLQLRGVALCTAAVALLALAGCGGKPSAAPSPQAVAVKAMQVLQQATPVTYEFVGEVEARDEAQVRARVSGNITAKMVKGGSAVKQGQPLFQIDRRSYEAALSNYQAQLAEAEAALSRVRRDVVRYQTLAAQQAIAQQMVDNILAEEQQALARVNACQAQVEQARIDLEDTTVVSPLNGRVDVETLSEGNFVQAGQTILATISSLDPIRVRFSMSETEYLRLARAGNSAAEWGEGLVLILSDGVRYPLTGKVEQVDRGLAQQTGTLALKALFENPDHLLVPGMFARIQATGEIRADALLVPQRAVQELLGKTLITVVAEGDKAESRPVTLGPRIGNMQIVETGLTPQDRVVVEGFMKAPAGTPLAVTMITPDDLSQPAGK